MLHIGGSHPEASHCLLLAICVDCWPVGASGIPLGPGKAGSAQEFPTRRRENMLGSRVWGCENANTLCTSPAKALPRGVVSWGTNPMHKACNSLCTGLAEALLGRIRRDIDRMTVDDQLPVLDLDLALDPMCGPDLAQLHKLALKTHTGSAI